MSKWTLRLVSAVTLVVVAGLPVMATTCEALCEQSVVTTSSDGTAEAPTHDGMAGCHEAPAPVDQRFTGASAHDCRTHDDSRRETEAALTSGRGAGAMLFVADCPAFAPVVFASSAVLVRADQTVPPDSASSHAALVLRI